MESSSSDPMPAKLSGARALRSRRDEGHPRSTQGEKLMLVAGLLERGLLVLGSFFLIFRLPFRERHAVDPLAALVLGHRHPACIGGILHPVRQAVAAEPGKVHQIDILDVRARTQMLEQAPERGGLEFGSGLVVERHGYRSFPWRRGARPRCHYNSDAPARFPARLATDHRTI